MFKFHGGSIIGPHHLIRLEENQDRWAFDTADGNYFLAVADGAGSLENSAIGADLAVTTAINFMKLHAINESVEIAKSVVIDAVLKASEMLKGQVDSDVLGCTLAVALITEDYYAVGVMGDALAVVKETNSDFKSVRPVQESEFRNITKLLTSKNFEIETFTGRVEELEFLALASDGIDYSSLDAEDVPVAGFWGKLAEWGLQDDFVMDEFLNFLYVQEKVEDDTTVVIAVEERFLSEVFS